jgi:mRNA interferase MazF
VKRGEIWTVAGGKDYASKPRPVVILQDDRFDMTDSITVCAFTTDPSEAPLFRLVVEPNESSGLRALCWLMVDKITTVPKSRIGKRVGRLAYEDMVRLNRAVLVFLGIAMPESTRVTQSEKKPGPSSVPALSWWYARINSKSKAAGLRPADSRGGCPQNAFFAYAVLLGRIVKSRNWVRTLDICIPFNCDTNGRISAMN